MLALVSFMVFYTFILALSQVLLKIGIDQKLATIEFKGLKSLLPLAIEIFTHPLIFISIVLLLLSFALWMYILSKFKLGIAFPMTALVYVFVAIMSIFTLGEKLSLTNYLGVFFVVLGIVLLLYKG